MLLILLSVLACTEEETTPTQPTAATPPVTEPAPAAEEPDLDPVQSELSENNKELEAPKLGEGSARPTTGGPSLGGPPSLGGSMGGAPMGGPPRLGGAPQLGGAPTLGGGPPKLGGSGSK